MYTEVQTFNQTMIKFQNPTILSSNGVSPLHAEVSLMATTYIKCRINSIVKKHETNLTKYLPTAFHEGLVGLMCYAFKNDIKTND